MNKELKQELMWAIDNIMPWDTFWLDVPKRYVHEVLIDIKARHRDRQGMSRKQFKQRPLRGNTSAC